MRILYSFLAIAAVTASFGQSLLNATVISATRRQITSVNGDMMTYGGPEESWIGDVSSQAVGPGAYYSNTQGPYVSSTAATTYRRLNEAFLTAPVGADRFKVGIVAVTGGSVGRAYVPNCLFWGTMNYSAPLLSNVMSGFIGGFAFGTGNLPQGFIYIFTVTTSSKINFVNTFFAYEEQIWNATNTATDVDGRPGYSVGGVEKGTGSNYYWRDANSNTFLENNEAFAFGPPNDKSNLVLEVAPEPSTYAAIVTGLLGIVGLRRRRK